MHIKIQIAFALFDFHQVTERQANMELKFVLFLCCDQMEIKRAILFPYDSCSTFDRRVSNS